MKKTAAIIYGWAEGEWHTRQLRVALEMQGYKITGDIRAADCIIAHSLGCYLIPEDHTASQVILIGVPARSPVSLLAALPRKLLLEARYTLVGVSFAGGAKSSYTAVGT